MENLNNGLLLILSGILGAVNTGMLIYAAWRKIKPEVKKLEIETESEIVEAAERNLEGAKISNEMLKERIEELKIALDEEKKARKEELEEERETRRLELEAEREIRRKESEYLRRRIKEAEREARDYRLWAAKLVKQVVESNKVPAPFIPSSLEDSDPGIAAISMQVKENQAEISKQWEKRKAKEKKEGEENDKQ